MSVLALAPLVVFCLLVDSLRRAFPTAPVREHVLGAGVLLGVTLVLATELLGALRGLSFAGIAGLWLVLSLAAAGARAWSGRRFPDPPPVRLPALGAADRALLGAVVVLGALAFVVAWLSPPQSSDSIGYHMTRVMHWIQNGSLAHYPTRDPPQLFEPPLAEILRLHLQVLSGGDRAGCLLQWVFAMGSIAGASLVARDLGGGRRAQLVAAVFAVTLPIGITQASSGKNGWVESFWLLSLVHFGTTLAPTAAASVSPVRMLAAFAALALELTTKISAWLFAPAFVLLAAWHLWRQRPAWRRLALAFVAGSLLAGAVASPYLLRNLSLYGHPLVDPVFRERNELESFTPAVVVSNVVRNVVFQMGTGIAAIDGTLETWTNGIHEWIGLDVSDPRTTQFGPFRISGPTLVEELAFSPLHILLIFAAALALLVSPRLRGGGGRVAHLAALSGAFVLYSSAVQWQPPSCRLLMPLLVLGAPLVGVVASEALRARTILAAAVILFGASLPYAVATKSRPLSFERGGILATGRDDLYFARVPWLRDDWRAATDEIRVREIRDLGAMFRADGSPEYLVWMLLGNTDPPIRIRNVLVADASRGLEPGGPGRGEPPELVAVFVSSPGNHRFDGSMNVDGIDFRLVRTFDSAALYEPAKSGTDPD